MASRTPRLTREARGLLSLALALIANNMALAGNNFADTVMSNRVDAKAMAAVAVGSSIWLVAILFVSGLLLSVTLNTAHSFGANRLRDVGRFMWQGMWLGVACSLVLGLLMAHVEGPLIWLGTDPSVIPIAAEYLKAELWGLPAVCVYVSLSGATEGIGHTRPILFIAVLGLAVNITCNYVFMFGKLGFPAMGAVGCGYATAVALWVNLLALSLYMRVARFYAPFGLLDRFQWPSWRMILELISIGAPISVTFVAEALFFTTVTLMMATFGAAAVAGYQAVTSFTAILLMIPLGVSTAATIRVGHAMGRGDPASAVLAGRVAIALCGAFMMLTGMLLLIDREGLIALVYSEDSDVADMAFRLLPFAAVLQVFDGLQLSAGGVLRGYKDTKIPMVLNVVAYWGVGAPLAWFFGVHLDGGPMITVIGMMIGLAFCAVLLNWRVERIVRRTRTLPVD